MRSGVQLVTKIDAQTGRMLTALYCKECSIVLVIDADTLRYTSVDSLRPPLILAARSIDEEYVRLATPNYTALFASGSLNIPKADRSIIERRYSQRCPVAVVAALGIVQCETTRLDYGFHFTVSYTRRLEPRYTGWPVALKIFIVP